MASTRQRVLACFKELHRTRLNVFHEDTKALVAGREKINESFKKNKDERDEETVIKLVQLGEASWQYLRASVVQTIYNKDKDVYEVKLRDPNLIDNKTGFDPDTGTAPDGSTPAKKCGQETEKTKNDSIGKT